MLKYLPSNKGAIGILTTLVLGIVLVMLATMAVLTGISSRTNAFVFNQSEKTFIGMEGCIEDALVRLSRNNAYGGGLYDVGDVECEAVVSGADPTRQVIVTGTRDTIVRDAVLSVQLDPDFGIIEWNE